MVEQIILTALDDVLLSVSDVVELETAADAYERLKPVLTRLQALDVPVIVFSQRDRIELEPIFLKLGLSTPFIAESGSAIFTPADHNPFTPALGERDDGYFVMSLGCPYVQARAGLRVIANVISHPLKGFGDFTVPQLQRAASLSETAAHQAKAREFSEPFMTPKAVDPAVLQQAAEEMGFEVILRTAEESRFSELVGAGAGLGVAAREVIAAYQQQMEADTVLKVVGMSNRSEDLSVLAAASEQAGVEWKAMDVVGSEAWVEAISASF
ncbi:MAG: haloacid dehalogenase [Phormidesmis sp.]